MSAPILVLVLATLVAFNLWRRWKAEDEVKRLEGLLDNARASMIRALDALESDSDLDARRNAFEFIQDQFEGVSEEDHNAAVALAEARRIREGKPSAQPEEEKRG